MREGGHGSPRIQETKRNLFSAWDKRVVLLLLLLGSVAVILKPVWAALRPEMILVDASSQAGFPDTLDPWGNRWTVRPGSAGLQGPGLTIFGPDTWLAEMGGQVRYEFQDRRYALVEAYTLKKLPSGSQRTWTFSSKGPNGVDEGGLRGWGDDLPLHAPSDWHEIVYSSSRILIFVMCGLIGGTYLVVRQLRAPRSLRVWIEVIRSLVITIPLAGICVLAALFAWTRTIRDSSMRQLLEQVLVVSVPTAMALSLIGLTFLGVLFFRLRSKAQTTN